jgi:hypothetical protein
MIDEQWASDVFDEYDGAICPECWGKLSATVFEWGVHVACCNCEYSLDLEPHN